MKISKSIIAAAVFATLPLAAFAGDKDKTVTPTGTATSSQFNTLDVNRDGRISPAEAVVDTKIVFSTADKNGDGYLDSSEYMNLDVSTESMPTPTRRRTLTVRASKQTSARYARAALRRRGPWIGSHACGKRTEAAMSGVRLWADAYHAS